MSTPIATVVETVFPCEAYDVFRVAMTTAATDKHKATVLQWPSVKARRQPGKEAEGEERPLRRHRVKSRVSDALDRDEARFGQGEGRCR
jgi:hypothetical protein